MLTLTFSFEGKKKNHIAPVMKYAFDLREIMSNLCVTFTN